MDANTGKTVVRVDERLLRPVDVNALVGDASKARRQLGWTARIGFAEMVAEMVAADERLAGRESVMDNSPRPVSYARSPRAHANASVRG